ncbi:MAG: HEAT repeat domain-containing protein [Methanothrix sp.]
MKRLVFAFILFTLLVQGACAEGKFNVGDRVWTTAEINLNVREGPGTSSPRIDSLIKGTVGTIVEEPVSKEGYNWCNISYDIGTTGWSVEDGLELAPGTRPQQPSEFSSWSENAIKWGRGHVDSEYSTYWWDPVNEIGYCMRFVANAFMQERGLSAGGNADDWAKKLYRFNQEPGGWQHAPRGAVILFDRDGENAYGHVGIYLGSNSLIHAYGSVQETTIEWAVAKPDVGRYLGWSYPSEEWRPIVAGQTQQSTAEPIPVTLTLYVHDEGASGPVISGAQVSGQDALGSSFYQTTDSSGFVIVKGSPGTWQFTVTKPGYDFNSWSQEITETCTKHAFLFVEETAVEARDDLSTNNDMSDLEIGESSEVNLLIEALMDRDWTVRLNAAQSLGEMGNAEAVNPLIYALGDDEWKVRRKAAWALGEIGDPRAIEPLSYLSVKDSDSDVRNEAKKALKKRVFGDTGDAREVNSIIVALTDKDSNVRLRAAQALGEMGNAEAVDPLIDALGDDEWEVRRKAAWALGEIGDPRAIEPLSYLSVKDSDSDVRNEAKDALKKRVFGDTGDARDVYSIIVALTDRDSNVRLRAAQALGEIGNAEAVDPLIDALGDDEWQVRRKAAWALGEIGDLRAIEPLSYLSVKDLDSDVRNEAKDALKKSVFGDTGDARDVDSITVALKDEDSNVRLRAAQALGEMGNAEAVDPLIGALKDDEWQVRRKAAWALGEIGDTRAVNPIIEALKDSDGDVRNEAKTALEKLGWQG